MIGCIRYYIVGYNCIYLISVRAHLKLPILKINYLSLNIYIPDDAIIVAPIIVNRSGISL